jgi:hypothetical protein
VPEPQARQRLLVKANFGQERQAIGVFAGDLRPLRRAISMLAA